MQLQPVDQLRARAYRIVYDGREHSDAAWRWALSMLGLPTPELVELEVVRTPFTPRELSLGATPWL